MEIARDTVTIVLYPDTLPLIPEAVEYANEHLLTAAGQRNRNCASRYVDVSPLPFSTQELLFDPQTSGGLLIATPSDEAEALTARIKETGDERTAIIGEIVPRTEKQ